MFSDCHQLFGAERLTGSISSHSTESAHRTRSVIQLLSHGQTHRRVSTHSHITAHMQPCTVVGWDWFWLGRCSLRRPRFHH